MAGGRLVKVVAGQQSKRGVKLVLKPKTKRLNSRDVRLVKSLKAPEMKFHTLIANTGSTVSYSGAMLSLADISQGDDITNRTGDKINCKRLHLKIQLNTGASWASQSTASFRVLVFRDTMNLGTDPVIGDLLDSNNNATLLQDITTIAKRTNRFKFLADKTVVMDLSNKTCVYMNLSRKCNFQIEYNSSSSSGNGKNMLYMLLLSDQPPTVGNAVYYAYSSRLYFTDI